MCRPLKEQEETLKSFGVFFFFLLWHSTFFQETVHRIWTQEGGSRGGMTYGCPNYLAHLYVCQKSLPVFSRQDSWTTNVLCLFSSGCNPPAPSPPFFFNVLMLCVNIFSLPFPPFLLFCNYKWSCWGLMGTVSAQSWLFYSISKHTLTYS